MRWNEAGGAASPSFGAGLPEAVIVLITQRDSGTVEIVSTAMRQGADHFLDKDASSLADLVATLKLIARERRQRIFVSHGHNALLRLRLTDYVLDRRSVALDSASSHAGSAGKDAEHSARSGEGDH